MKCRFRRDRPRCSGHSARRSAASRSITRVVQHMLAAVVLTSGLTGLLAATGAAAATWGGLYAAAITNPIPIFDWLFCAVPAALAGLLARGRAEEPLVPALLAAVPAAAVNTLGWSVAGRPDAGLRAAAFSGIGLLVGLGVAMAVGERGPTARPSRRS